MPQYLTFRKVQTQEEAYALQELLIQHNIPSKLEESSALLGAAILGQQFDPPFHVKIPADNFTKATAVVHAAVNINVNEVEPDYYLLSFSTDELKDVLAKKDEWGSYDHALALQLLKERGIMFTDRELEAMQQQRMQELARPAEGKAIWPWIAYLSVILTGVLGLIVTGALVRTAKKTLPDGSRVYVYREDVRRHGRNFLIISALAILITIIDTFNGGYLGWIAVFGLASSLGRL